MELCDITNKAIDFLVLGQNKCPETWQVPEMWLKKGVICSE